MRRYDERLHLPTETDFDAPSMQPRWSVEVYNNNDILLRTFELRAKSDDEAIHAIVLKRIRNAAYYLARRI